MSKFDMVTTKQFLDDSFLIDNKTGEYLYHNVAAVLPIIDYHNHIDPVHVAEDKKYDNIGDMWVVADPYKHRAMRINGVPEQSITGNADAKAKYLKWAEIFPGTIGSPLYHWSCLELKRIFNIDELLSCNTAERIWDQCNSQLIEPGFSAVGLLKKWNTEIICTSDDLTDALQPHQHATNNHDFLQVKPSLRADTVLAFDTAGYKNWLENLQQLVNIEVSSLEAYKQAIIHRLEAFDKAGCRMSDHALNSGFRFELPTDESAKMLFDKVLAGKVLNENELVQLQSYMLRFLGEEYGRRNWIMQLHIGAQRSTSSRLKNLAGPAGGYACIGNNTDVKSLCGFLDSLEEQALLPEVILYALNPSDYPVFASLTGSFVDDHLPGKVQLGPAWWYNDHQDGIYNQLAMVANYSMLSRFIGMTTDSRSMLSFSRHEYFRRVLCNMIGAKVENGEWPNDKPLLEQLVSDIAYNNIRNKLLKVNHENQDNK